MLFRSNYIEVTALTGTPDITTFGRFSIRDSSTVIAHARARSIERVTIPGSANSGDSFRIRSEERRVGKECRSRWSPYH